MDGFGFTGLMDKLGVERRLLTAGDNKVFSIRSRLSSPGSSSMRRRC
jgi:ClpP class serine protease